MSLRRYFIPPFFSLRVLMVFLIYGGLALVVALPIYAAQLIHGDLKKSTSASFSFSIGPHAFSQQQGRLYVGATQPKKDNAYALAYANSTGTSFVALAPETVEIDGKKQKNPLHGSGIRLLTLMGTVPLVVVNNNPERFYLIKSFVHNPRHDYVDDVDMLVSPQVHDARGATTQGIIGSCSAVATSTIFLAVEPHTGIFGMQGSGIALGVMQQENGKESNDEIIKFVNANNGKPRGNKAVALDVSSAALTINAPLQKITNQQVNLIWEPLLERLYIPLEVLGGAGSSDGAHGLALGTLENGRLILTKVVQESAVGQNSIIAARGANTRVSIRHIRVMKTTTSLTYAIVAGGVGSSDKTEGSVYAIPIVSAPAQDKGSTAAVGMVADKNQLPRDLFDARHVFVRRDFVVPAKNPEDMVNPHDAAALVGGGEAPGSISAIDVYNDAVCATVATQGGNGGIYLSHPRFDSHGKFLNWTAWERVGGASSSVALGGFAFDGKTTDFWYLPVHPKNTISLVYRTAWDPSYVHDDSDTKKDQTMLAQTVSSLFEKVPAGIQGLQAYPPIQAGLSPHAGQRLSLIVALGNNTVVLVETGNDANGFFAPVTQFGHAFVAAHGTLEHFVPGVRMLEIHGGVLDTLGPLVSSTIVTDGIFGWLVVGGSNGIAVLARPDGSGWPMSPSGGLETGFVGLSSDMRFVALGHYEDVYKLVADGKHLFFITPKSFGRIDVSQHVIHDFKGGVDLIHAGHNTYLLDTMVSEDLALVATSSGLIHSGMGVDIRTCPNQSLAHWTDVIIPAKTAGVARLCPIGFESDLVHGGNFYFTAASPSNDQAYLYRAIIKGGILERDIELFPDYFSRAYGRAFFFNMDSYQHFVAYDGATFLFSGVFFGSEHPVPSAQVVVKNPQEGKHFAILSDASPLLSFDKSHLIGPLTRDFGSGSWMAWGDFGLRANG